MEIKRVAQREFLSADEAAAVLGVSKETLRFWRYTNKHVDEIPPHKHVSRRIFYRTADVMRFSQTMYCPA
ncbi:helix-turn-helix domain-containing protein [Pseudomonas sp. NBRC 111129]|uniref:helix-turn-helix domain-containing protein n=1 Tax=Pseudomonas sp. NBRC 111129 TaxID=1661044 RepID=UPI0006D41965|nr:helix-turn-helix domain-containing protein [Pseudomonas sp. NBRC 111129]